MHMEIMGVEKENRVGWVCLLLLELWLFADQNIWFEVLPLYPKRLVYRKVFITTQIRLESNADMSSKQSKK